MVQYTYVLNNPLRYVDPLGLVVSDWDKANVTSSSDIKKLEENTKKWEEANAKGDEAGKAAAAASSKSIRDEYRTGTERDSASKDGNTVGTPAPKSQTDDKKPTEDPLKDLDLTDGEKQAIDDYIDDVYDYVSSMSDSDWSSWDSSDWGGGGDYAAIIKIIIDAGKASDLHAKQAAMSELSIRMVFDNAREIVCGIRQENDDSGTKSVIIPTPILEFPNIIKNSVDTKSISLNATSNNYIFYLPEWENEALDDKKRLMQYYNLTEDQIHLITLTSKDDLKNGWNSMGIDADGNSAPIGTVIIAV